MDTHKRHSLSLTADFSVDVYLIRGNETDGLWVADEEDGTFSAIRSVVTDDDGRTCETLQGGFKSVSDAAAFINEQ